MEDVGGTPGSVTGRRSRPGLYPYRVRGRRRSGTVLWLPGRRDGEPDEVFAVPNGDASGAGWRVPVFTTGRQAGPYTRRHGLRLVSAEANVLELVRAERWLADPVRRAVPAGDVLGAWNFFEDLARGLRTVDALPPQGPVHDSAYEKLFGGECGEWTPAERACVLELLTAGAALWNTCPVVVRPR
ncbi:hypothetical protein [Streptomyces sp. NBC_00454]|uniref:hypothetical protein n=1 Tax=Streptomyces sp. NBC_00454 TaxID=2975747 RepID=UPI0030E4A0F3